MQGPADFMIEQLAKTDVLNAIIDVVVDYT
jgi:hypothetical protein